MVHGRARMNNPRVSHDDFSTNSGMSQYLTSATRFDITSHKSPRMNSSHWLEMTFQKKELNLQPFTAPRASNCDQKFLITLTLFRLPTVKSFGTVIEPNVAKRRFQPSFIIEK